MDSEHCRIKIVDYDPCWPELFNREVERIQAALGHRALHIEHTGSTSVPGLAAKPVIDILLVVVDSATESEYAPALEQAGYSLHIREPDWYQHRMFKGPDTDVNLHVFSHRCPEIERMVMFRDWLRINESDRELYVCTKRELALREWENTQSYADAKTEVIERIMGRALCYGFAGGTSMNDETAVTTMLADYYTAFSTLDLEAIVPYFHQPALFIGPAGVFAVPTSAALAGILTTAMEDLRARGYGRSEFELEQIRELSSTAAMASGVAVRYKSDGQVLERVGISYLLHKTGDHWRIAVMVLPDTATVLQDTATVLQDTATVLQDTATAGK